MKILLSGDTHMSTMHIEYLFRNAKVQDVDHIVVLGDFGYTFTEKFINVCIKGAEETGILLYFIDGNHDNHTFLRAQGAWDRDVPVQMWPGVFYLPRGCRVEWGGKTFLALGGAVSIDRDERVPYVSWWPTESLTIGQMYRATQGGPVDILLSHDAPADVEGLEEKLNVVAPEKLLAESRHHRELLTQVVEATKPRWVFHGHYHYRYRGRLGDTRIVGLDCGAGRDSILVLDTEADDL